MSSPTSATAPPKLARATSIAQAQVLIMITPPCVEMQSTHPSEVRGPVRTRPPARACPFAGQAASHVIHDLLFMHKPCSQAPRAVGTTGERYSPLGRLCGPTPAPLCRFERPLALICNGLGLRWRAPRRSEAGVSLQSACWRHDAVLCTCCKAMPRRLCAGALPTP
jgi:hypothetical protein